MYELNGDYLDDERSNLDIQLSRPILVVGDLGLWHLPPHGIYGDPERQHPGLPFTANVTWITALGMWIKTATSAAMPSIMTARTIPLSCLQGRRERHADRESEKENSTGSIATRADITRVTRRLGDEIAHVYGFSIPPQAGAGAGAITEAAMMNVSDTRDCAFEAFITNLGNNTTRAFWWANG